MRFILSRRIACGCWPLQKPFITFNDGDSDSNKDSNKGTDMDNRMDSMGMRNSFQPLERYGIP